MKIIWVDPTNGLDTNNGERLAPLKTINKALEYFVSGDQIRLLDGIFLETESIVISGVDGSIFSENPRGSTIQPEKVKSGYNSCIELIDCPRFSLCGINILQSIDSTNNFIGIRANNVDKFICLTCEVSDFEIPSGSGFGIYVSGSSLGRIENCSVYNLSQAGGVLTGIYSSGNLHIIDCEVTALSGAGNCKVIGLDYAAS